MRCDLALLKLSRTEVDQFRFLAASAKSAIKVRTLLIFFIGGSQINEHNQACSKFSHRAFWTSYFLLMEFFIFVLRRCVRDVIG